MEDVYDYVNMLVKRHAYILASLVMAWAMPIAERIESICGELLLRQAFVDSKKHLVQVLEKSDNKYTSACFCRCIGKLADLMQVLHDKYQEIKQTP
jgi:hypothetical protein